MARRTRSLLALERALLLGGGALLVLVLLAFLHQQLFAAWDRAVFGRPSPRSERDERPAPWPAAPLDTSAWSAGRIAALLDTPTPFAASRLALLEIPSIDLAVVVLDGTAEWTLNRGVGRIEGTAPPGAPGNAGIAGHRDGFFRGLERIEGGELLRLRLPGVRQERVYRVAWVRVVRPEEVWVLAPTAEPSLTLVTCFPFRFVGRAPERYVVRAVGVPTPRVGAVTRALTGAFPVLQPAPGRL
jgi:sortase A